MATPPIPLSQRERACPECGEPQRSTQTLYTHRRGHRPWVTTTKARMEREAARVAEAYAAEQALRAAERRQRAAEAERLYQAQLIVVRAARRALDVWWARRFFG
jgi:hypothetical protein